MRSNRTGRTTDNRLFRWNGRFFFTFFNGCFYGVKLKLLRRLLYGRQNSKKERQCLILLPCWRLPGRGQELLHVPAHGGIVLLLPPRLLTLGGQRRPPFFIRVWDGLACRLGQRFKAFHALRSPPETRAPASNFDCSGKGPENLKIRKRVLACYACCPLRRTPCVSSDIRI